MKKRLLAIVMLLLVPVGVAQAADQVQAPRGDTYYGINFVEPTEPWLSLGAESGAGVVRWQFNWRDHEPSPGRWEWGLADSYIDTWRNAGIQVHALLHYPPDWAMENPGTGLMPVNRDLPWDHPDNGWGRYCHEFAKRYRGRIFSYEIWNEPDLDQYWEGNARQYFHIMKSCYMAIKAADPNTPVSMAGMALLVEPDFFPSVVRYAVQDPEGPANNYFFDAANIHMYNYARLTYTLTGQTRWVLRQYGLGDKPIWITETNIALRGYGINDDEPGWWNATEEEIAWYMVQAVANAHAADAERFMVFRLHDSAMEQAWGLVKNDGEPRMSYTAYQTAIGLMTDIVDGDRQTAGDIEKVILLRGDGTRLTVVFTTSGRAANVTLPAATTEARVYDSQGNTTLIQARGGAYRLNLPAAEGRNFSRPNDYTVGGPPLILVEENVGSLPNAPAPSQPEEDKLPPTASLAVEAIPGSQESIRITWSASDLGGSGVETYDVEFSRDGGLTWQTWLEDTQEVESLFEMPSGGYYLFRVRAVDEAGNMGAFSQPIEGGIKPVGYLTGFVVDLRGQRIPFARLTLGDGTLHDADETGRIQLELPLGEQHLQTIDGSIHGVFYPDETIDVQLAEEYVRTWLLLPRENLVANGSFNQDLEGWQIASPASAQAVFARGEQLLQLAGKRSPWGDPSASVTVDLPGYANGVISFFYRQPDAASHARLRAIHAEGSDVLWESVGPTPDFTRAFVDLTPYAGRRITLRFELVGRGKGVPSGILQIDHVLVGDVPILPNQ
ncbi:MAG: hypothetical protein GYB64_08445 [Chloroflexi bacterium]|nr:hypothetical protein [Chloroflexota bacterium]